MTYPPLLPPMIGPWGPESKGKFELESEWLEIGMWPEFGRNWPGLGVSIPRDHKSSDQNDNYSKMSGAEKRMCLWNSRQLDTREKLVSKCQINHNFLGFLRSTGWKCFHFTCFFGLIILDCALQGTYAMCCHPDCFQARGVGKRSVFPPAFPP